MVRDLSIYAELSISISDQLSISCGRALRSWHGCPPAVASFPAEAADWLRTHALRAPVPVVLKFWCRWSVGSEVAAAPLTPHQALPRETSSQLRTGEPSHGAELLTGSIGLLATPAPPLLELYLCTGCVDVACMHAWYQTKQQRVKPGSAWQIGGRQCCSPGSGKRGLGRAIGEIGNSGPASSAGIAEKCTGAAAGMK